MRYNWQSESTSKRDCDASLGSFNAFQGARTPTAATHTALTLLVAVTARWT